MPLLLDITLLAVGMLLLLLGAESLVRGASAIAQRIGVSAFIIGLTVVAIGTSAPELFVTIHAALRGSPELAAGNIVGSNIANVGLILGLTALIYPVTCRSPLLRNEVLIMILTSMLGLWMMADLRVGRIEGSVLLCIFAAFMTVGYIRGRRAGPENVPLVGEELARSDEGSSAAGRTPAALLRDAAMVLIGLALLAGGSHLCVEHATNIAEWLGVPDRVIGLTAVAVGTSLPELATCLVAAIKRRPEIVLGNILGSNVCNILLILGAAGVIAPLDLPRAMLVLDMPVLILASLACIPVMLVGGRISRTEGALLFVGYCVYTVVVYRFNPQILG